MIFAVVIGAVLFLAGLAMPLIGVTDVTHDTEAILSVMVFLSGCICLAIGFGSHKS